jgi:hypothetical protein
MKKLLTLALMAGSIAVAAPAAEAKTSSGAASFGDPQIRVQIGDRRNDRRYQRHFRNRRIVVSTYTRVIGRGRNRFRETVRITRLPNGRTTQQVIRRERINW